MQGLDAVFDSGISGGDGVIEVAHDRGVSEARRGQAGECADEDAKDDEDGQGQDEDRPALVVNPNEPAVECPRALLS